MREGEYARDRIPVVSHALDIPARLKELDSELFIMLNRKARKFEIWREENGRGILECVLPYGELDERTLRHVRQHRMERMETLLREIEQHNRQLEEEAKRSWLNRAGERTKEAVDYLKNKSSADEIPKELMEE